MKQAVRRDTMVRAGDGGHETVPLQHSQEDLG